MTLVAIDPGPMVTVQDAGRLGLRHAGVSAAGPMDGPLFRLANALVGNRLDAAALEFARFGGRFRADAPMVIALAGNASLNIGSSAVTPFAAHRVAAGDEIRIGALADSIWGYLAAAGGIETPPLLGSRATHLRFGLGQALSPGRSLPLGVSTPTLKQCTPRQMQAPRSIRVTLGPQADRFDKEILERFLTEPFTVSRERDRMAMILNGPTLPASRGHDIVSDGTVPGSIQVPGSGRAMVLMAEAQTTGGYAKIATVIGPDLPRLAQLADGAEFKFTAVTRDEAEALSLAGRKAETASLAELPLKIEGTPPSEFLLSCNLAGAIWPAEEVVPDA